MDERHCEAAWSDHPMLCTAERCRILEKLHSRIFAMGAAMDAGGITGLPVTLSPSSLATRAAGAQNMAAPAMAEQAFLPATAATAAPTEQRSAVATIGSKSAVAVTESQSPATAPGGTERP